jgi:hypothetical protein
VALALREAGAAAPPPQAVARQKTVDLTCGVLMGLVVEEEIFRDVCFPAAASLSSGWEESCYKGCTLRYRGRAYSELQNQ